MENKKGKFIVIYGVNNLGKSTQAKMLANRLNQCGYNSEYIKYPIYDLEPAGKLINEYYRSGNPFHLTARESQLLHYIDRKSFEPILKSKLSKGVNIIAEDYFGTAVAWGMAAGVDYEFLKYLYSFVHPEDMTILFDGERFRESIEKTHHHEQNEFLISQARIAHQRVGEEYGWQKINANLSIMKIHEILWKKAVDLIEKSANYFIAPNFKELHDQLYINKPQDQSQPSSTKKHPAESNKILIQRLSPISRLPQRTFSSDVGFNLFAADYYSIPPQRRAAIKTGIKIAIPESYVGIITKADNTNENKIHVLMEIIDAKYRNEIIINIINLGNDIYNVAPGVPIARLLIQKTETLEIIESEIR